LHSPPRHVIFNMDLNLKSMNEGSVSKQSAMCRKITPVAWPGGMGLRRGRAGVIRSVITGLIQSVRAGVIRSVITGLIHSVRAGVIRQVARLVASGGVSLFRYLKDSGLFSGRGMVILSRHDRATFGTVDLRRATTLITLRRLNMVKHLEMFLSSLSRILPPGTNFVGCFSPARVESEDTERSGREYDFPARVLHSGRMECHSLNRGKVSEMLERNGLSLISMTEMNGVTYFHSRKIPGLPLITA